MPVSVFYHEDARLHENGAGHPERPERLSAVWNAIEPRLSRGTIELVEPVEASDEALLRVHTAAYIDRIRQTAGTDRTQFDLDTSANRHTARAAALGAGAGVAAVDLALEESGVRPLVLMRPPGHHALDDVAMGFCIYNTAAVAAAHARARGVERVAIVDWDVHHGNGTEYIFRDRSDVFYASIHQSPHYPGTGPEHYRGEREGEGYTLNVPLPAGCGRDEYLRALRDRVVPALDRFEPGLLIVSAGFDVHERDPLGGMRLAGDDFALITRELVGLADRRAAGRIVHILEGGYDLEGLSDGVSVVADTLATA
jgi:acetoin utilization deacetylase AcuC-like enzyme